MKKILVLLVFLPFAIFAQEDLLGELEDEVSQEVEEVSSVFKGIKIINFESTKLVGKNQLQFILYHRFGTLSDGVDNFLGLDDASVRVQFAYGVTVWLQVSASRSALGKSMTWGLNTNSSNKKIMDFPLLL